MRLSVGQKAPVIELPSIEGKQVNTDAFLGNPYLISFYRFSSCPFCNLRVHQLIARQQELADNFKILAIFDATLADLTKHTSKHEAPFPIVADEQNIFYKAYGIEFSIVGVLKGIFFRLPTLLRGMLKGYVPTNMFKRGLTIMPADFLIDEQGFIQEAHYGTDEGDHLSFNAIQKFAERGSL